MDEKGFHHEELEAIERVLIAPKGKRWYTTAVKAPLESATGGFSSSYKQTAVDIDADIASELGSDEELDLDDENFQQDIDLATKDDTDVKLALQQYKKRSNVSEPQFAAKSTDVPTSNQGNTSGR